ncbi:hypothetical protein GC194_11695 [bacterium]|nr:hypothetical protein [bacterium]
MTDERWFIGDDDVVFYYRALPQAELFRPYGAFLKVANSRSENEITNHQHISKSKRNLKSREASQRITSFSNLQIFKSSNHHHISKSANQHISKSSPHCHKVMSVTILAFWGCYFRT